MSIKADEHERMRLMSTTAAPVAEFPRLANGSRANQAPLLSALDRAAEESPEIGVATDFDDSEATEPGHGTARRARATTEASRERERRQGLIDQALPLLDSVPLATLQSVVTLLREAYCESRDTRTPA